MERVEWLHGYPVGIVAYNGTGESSWGGTGESSWGGTEEEIHGCAVTLFLMYSVINIRRAPETVRPSASQASLNCLRISRGILIDNLLLCVAEEFVIYFLIKVDN